MTPAPPVRFSTTSVVPVSASFCADDARKDVADAAGLGRHQHADRPRRIVLRKRSRIQKRARGDRHRGKRRNARAHCQTPARPIAVDPDPGAADHLAVAVRFRLDELGKGFRRAERHRGALVDEPAFHVLRRKHLVALAVEPCDRRLRRARRREEAEPCADLDLHSLLDHGRHVRQHRGALLGRDAERSHPAGLDRSERQRHHVEHHVDVAGGEVLRRGRRAFVGHMHDVDSGLQLEQLGRDVARRADALRGVGELAGIGLGIGDQLFHGLRRHRRMHHEDVRHRDAEQHRRETLERLVGHLLHVRQHRQHRVIADQEGVAVGRGLCDRVGADDACGARAVLDHDSCGVARLAELLLEQPHQLVADAGRRGRHDELDRLRRIVVGERWRGEARGQQCNAERGAKAHADHEILPAVSLFSLSLSHAQAFRHPSK